MAIASLSPRMTTPNQMPTSRPIRTSPITAASGATQLVSAILELRLDPVECVKRHVVVPSVWSRAN